MKTIIYPLLVLSLLGCRPDKEIDEQFRPLLDLYLIHSPDTSNMKYLLEMKAGPLPPPLGGRTMFQKNGLVGVTFNHYTTITIVPDTTDKCSWTRNVLHELGHALQKYEHSTNPDSIMFENTTVSDNTWCDTLDVRLENMFNSNGVN